LPRGDNQKTEAFYAERPVLGPFQCLPSYLKRFGVPSPVH